MATQNNNGFPMISEKTWWIIRDKFKASLPNQVTSNYIKSFLEFSSEASANSNAISPMKRMGLLDNENRPTTLANAWRMDQTYKEACNQIIRNVYPTDLLDLFPDSSVDKKIATNWFMGNGVGQAAAVKMVALFTLLKKGEINENKASTPKKSTNVSSGSVKRSATKTSMKHTEVNPNIIEVTPESSKSQTSSRPDLHIDLQIHISPESTPDQIEKIFASIAKHIYRFDN